MTQKNTQMDSIAGKRAGQQAARTLGILFDLDTNRVPSQFLYDKCPYTNPDDCGLKDYCAQCKKDEA